MCIITIFSISACGRNNLEPDEVDDEDISESIFSTENSRMSLEEFKLKLLESISIELKNTNNDTIGVINNRNNITVFITRILEYDIEENHTELENQNVIGPINIYFGDGTAIYGLMKDGYIYIDGYYFIINQPEKNFILNYFEKNIQEIFSAE